GKREGQNSRSGHARRWHITNQASQFKDRPLTGSRAEKCLIGKAFLVKRENVERYCPGVKQSDGKVRRVARPQQGKNGEARIGESRQHASVETGIRANAVRDGRKCRAVPDQLRGLVTGAGAAAAELFFRNYALGLRAHLPPSIWSTKMP